MEQLIGKTIKEVQLDENDFLLKLITEDNENILIRTEGDCCNRVWFVHISGIESLIGAKINEVVEKKWELVSDEKEIKGNDEYEEVCFWTIKTDKGYFDFEVRNNHNGYYGGFVSVLTQDHYLKYYKDLKFRVLKEDF